MAYTEIKKRNSREYYYRVRSVRENEKVSKERIYLGVNITKEQLSIKEAEADRKFMKEKVSKNIIKIKTQIVEIIKKSGVKKAGIFGSYARGDQKASSDIDILIEPTKEMGFFEIIKLEDELKEKLKKRVDLITYASIHRLLKDRILQEEVRII